MRNLILILSTLSFISCVGQAKLEGMYRNNDELIFMEFSDNNEFKLFMPSGSKCANLNYDKGNFIVESDTLYFNLDYNYDTYKDDFNKQGFEFFSESRTKNDSLNISVEVVDLMDNNPLPEVTIKIEGQEYSTDFDGKLLFKTSINKEHKISARIYDTPIIDTLFTSTTNTKIRIKLNSNLMDLSKDYVLKYKVISASNEKLILKSMNDEKTIELIKSKK
jgi:hypothetical protein